MTKPKKTVINEAFAQKVLSIVDQGLVAGMGIQRPGKMCVEAAVAYAAGEGHNDNPRCVDFYLSRLKIELNDWGTGYGNNNGWQSSKSRSKGLRRLAIAQLGSVNKFNSSKFWKLVSDGLLEAYKTHLILNIPKIKTWEEAEGVNLNTYHSKEVDDIMSVYVDFMKMPKEKALFATAELFVQALKKMKIPGTKYLYLTETKAKRK